MKLACIIVTYKTNSKILNKAIEGIKKLGVNDRDIFIIDNTRENRGYAKAVNLGVKRALKEKKYDLFCVANPDIAILKGNKKIVEKLFSKFDVFGGLMIQDENLYFGGYVDKGNLAAGLYTIKKSQQKGFAEVDFVSGSLLFFSSRVFKKLRGFDEDFFLYYEDVDFCYRARKLGFRIGVSSDIVYEHLETSRALDSKEKYLLESWGKFAIKHGSVLQIIRAFYKIIPKYLKQRV